MLKSGNMIIDLHSMRMYPVKKSDSVPIQQLKSRQALIDQGCNDLNLNSNNSATYQILNIY